jgi:hypothetical protein
MIAPIGGEREAARAGNFYSVLACTPNRFGVRLGTSPIETVLVSFQSNV